jgi:hypothetical protein
LRGFKKIVAGFRFPVTSPEVHVSLDNGSVPGATGAWEPETGN